MAEIIGFTDIKSLYDELVTNLDLNREHPEKFVATLLYAYPSNKGLLETFNIKLKRASQWSVLTIDPETLEKTLLRARDFGFLEAYQQNPSFIKRDIDKTLKIMGEAGAMGLLDQVNETKKWPGYLFSNRGFNYVKNSLTKESDEELKRGRAA